MLRKISAFYLKIFSFLEVKFGICLNRRVFDICNANRKSKRYLIVNKWRKIYQVYRVLLNNKYSRYRLRLMGTFCNKSSSSLRKYAYSNILKISPPQTERFQIKILIFSYFCSKHDCGRGGSNEYPQSIF